MVRIHTYDSVKDQLKGWGCTLLLTEDEFKEFKISKMKLPYIASCGHKVESYHHNMMYRNTHFMCKECVNKQVSKSMKNRSAVDCFDIEFAGYKHLQALLHPQFELYRTSEGCMADIAIRPSHVDDNSWMMVQLKVTSKANNGQYTFTLKRSYPDCLLVLVCLQPMKLWIIKGEDVSHLTKVAISSNKYSIYDIYEVNNDTIITVVHQHYGNIKLNVKLNIDIPSSPSTQIEKQWRVIREQCVPLDYEYPDVMSRCYDFIVNNKKIQEKVGGIRKDRTRTMYFMLQKSGPKVNNKRTKVAYGKGDNDYYWLHIPPSNKFMVIPESILLSTGHISTSDKIGNKCLCVTFEDDFVTSKREIFIPYIFSYNNLDSEKLHRLLFN